MELMKRVVKTSVVAATTSLISNALNLSETKVGKIIGMAVPMITFITADDPSISNLLFDNSKKHKKSDRMTPEEGEKEFFDVFGEKGHAMSRLIAKETDSTEEEVNGVLGMTMSVVETGLGRVIEEDDVDEEEFNRRFKKEAEEEEKRDPSMAKMAKRIIT